MSPALRGINKSQERPRQDRPSQVVLDGVKQMSRATTGSQNCRSRGLFDQPAIVDIARIQVLLKTRQTGEQNPPKLPIDIERAPTSENPVDDAERGLAVLQVVDDPARTDRVARVLPGSVVEAAGDVSDVAPGDGVDGHQNGLGAASGIPTPRSTLLKASRVLCR